MAFDGIVTRQIVNELNTCLINGKINKVFEPNTNEILLGIYANRKNYLLNICIDSVNYRLNLTTTTKPNPINAPNFCMLLRKHLIGMHITAIYTYDLERLVTIELEGFNELNDLVTKKLIIELMGKHSNIILINENNRIIDSLRHLDTFSNSNRNILPSYEYVLPQSQKSSFLEVANFNEFLTIFSNLNEENIINVIVNTYTGISKSFLQYLTEKLNLNNSLNTTENLEILYNEMKKILNSSKLACVRYNNSSKNDYVIDLFDAPTYSSLCVNFFIDDFYLQKETDETFKNYRNSILKLILNELKKYTKRLSNINKKLEECNNMATYQLYGELITANLYKIAKDEHTDKIQLENYYDNNNLIEIPLDKSISLAYNAKKYFKKYNKLKNALEIVSIQKKDTAKEINYLESIVYELENAKNVSDVHSIYDEIAENVLFKNLLSKKTVGKKSKHAKAKTEEVFFPSPYILDGYTIYIGKNNMQNDYLTLRYAHNNDLWFHTKDIHGSHVILKTNGNEVEQETINKCASIAAFYSKAQNSSNVAVDYTYVRYVKKPSGAKPGMVIYTNYTTVNVNPNNFEIKI